MRQTSTLASKLLLEKKTTADSCMNENETVTCIIVTEINKCFIIDFYRIVKLILLIDLFSL